MSEKEVESFEFALARAPFLESNNLKPELTEAARDKRLLKFTPIVPDFSIYMCASDARAARR